MQDLTRHPCYGIKEDIVKFTKAIVTCQSGNGAVVNNEMNYLAATVSRSLSYECWFTVTLSGFYKILMINRCTVVPACVLD